MADLKGKIGCSSVDMEPKRKSRCLLVPLNKFRAYFSYEIKERTNIAAYAKYNKIIKFV